MKLVIVQCKNKPLDKSEYTYIWPSEVSQMHDDIDYWLAQGYDVEVKIIRRNDLKKIEKI